MPRIIQPDVMARDRFAARTSLSLRAAFLFAVLIVLTLQTALPGAAQDNKKQPVLKTVHGLVLDKSENALPEALVFLKNLQNNSVKTSFADDQGNYRFSGLDPNADYEIHAEFKGDVSPTRRLSSLDGRKDIYQNLVIPRKK
ncbi:MAG TPA: carboxypeptidase-like regulatory domain-containing protein [Candidatus Acidoferrales bacterium]|nr:carboxypeptidase-like regulatory domain-containing protein [Candidatus Acidoferrales bacterium]